jgi:hypothetical protein
MYTHRASSSKPCIRPREKDTTIIGLGYTWMNPAQLLRCLQWFTRQFKSLKSTNSIWHLAGSVKFFPIRREETPNTSSKSRQNANCWLTNINHVPRNSHPNDNNWSLNNWNIIRLNCKFISNVILPSGPKWWSWEIFPVDLYIYLFYIKTPQLNELLRFDKIRWILVI